MTRHESFFFRKSISSLLLVCLVLLLDQVTKYLALSALVPGQPHTLIYTRYFSFFWTLTTNTGAAWGIGAHYPLWLFLIRIGILVVLFFLWKRSTKNISSLSIALIVSGAISNIVDGFFHGGVIDFLHLRFFTYDYPIFNVADCAIFVGTVMLILTYPHAPSKKSKR